MDRPLDPLPDDEGEDDDEAPWTTTPLRYCLRPWYFGLDELIHRGPDRLLLRLPGYWRVRRYLCDYVDRRFGVTEAEMDRT